MTRDLGKLAQSKLEEWLAQLSITGNPSIYDKEGWDYFLQFPVTPPMTGVPLDRRPTRIECLIQVKGTGTTEHSEQIKLSNWEKMVTSPLPAFFLIIDFGGEVNPQNAYLVHVNQRWMGRVLERLRQLPDADKESLNRHRLSLTWSEADQLETLDGKGLDAAIRHHVGGDFDNYVQNKKRLRETVGRDTQFKVTFTSAEFKNTDDMYKEMIDFAIGLRDSVPVSKLTIEKDVRFGIPAERAEYQRGEISILDRSDLARSVTLIVSNLERSKTSTFPADIYSPLPFDPNKSIPEEHIRFRLASEIGDLIIQPFGKRPGFEIQLRFAEGTKSRKLRELLNFWRAISIFENAKSEGLILKILDGKNPPYKQQITELNSPTNEHSELVKSIASALEYAWYFARLVDVPDDTDLAIEQILAQHDVLKNIRELTDPNIRVFSINTNLFGDDPDTERAHALIYSRVLVFGKLKIPVFIGFAGHATIMKSASGEKEFQIKTPNRVLLECKQLTEIDERTFTRMAQDIKARMRTKYEVLDVIPQSSNPYA